MASARAALIHPVSTVQVRLDQVEEDPKNARQRFDQAKLQQLADSIRAQGILQAPVARLLPNGNYRLIDGHRRLRAAKLAGLTEIRIDVVELDDQAAAVAAATANLQREDLTPYEQARAFQAALDLGMQKKQLCDAAGIVFNTLKARLELLELPEGVASLIGVDGFTIQHAQAFLPYVKHQKLLDAGLAYVQACRKGPEGLDDADEMPVALVRVLREANLVRTRNDIENPWEIPGVDEKLRKLDGIQVKMGRNGYADRYVITDVDAFNVWHSDELKARTAREAKAKSRDKQASDDADEDSAKAKLEHKAAVLASERQLTAMAEHVAKLAKWNDDLQRTLIAAFWGHARSPQREIEEKAFEAATGMTEDKFLDYKFQDDDRPGVGKLLKKDPQAVYRLLAALLFFDGREDDHFELSRGTLRVPALHAPLDKLLTGKSHSDLLQEARDELKAAAKAKAAKKAARQALAAPVKVDKNPKPGKTAPKAAAKPKAKGKAKPAAKKPAKDPPAVAKARAKLAEKGKQSKLTMAVARQALANRAAPDGVEVVIPSTMKDAAAAVPEAVQA